MKAMILKSKSNNTKKNYTKDDIKKIRATLIQEKSKALKPLETKIKELEHEILKKERQIEEITKLLLKACEEKNVTFLADAPKQSKQIKEQLNLLYQELLVHTEKFEEKTKYYDNEFENIKN
ncbi:hypothetical protein MASR1M68_16120 [Elusimicrobiota bacterium]